MRSRTTHNRAFGLRNGCRAGSERRVRLEESLQMSDSAYGIRTHVTAVRGGALDRGRGRANGHVSAETLPRPSRPVVASADTAGRVSSW